MLPRYDLVFVGNASVDMMRPFQEEAKPIRGGAVLMSAMAAAWSGKRLAVVTRMAASDTHYLEPLNEAGIDVFPVHTAVSTRHRAFHPSADENERRIVLEQTAGFFGVDDLPPMEPTFVHLAGVTNQEFDLEFMSGLRERGFRLSIDMQGVIHCVDGGAGEVRYADIPEKKLIATMTDTLKFDVREAAFLTGLADPAEAAVEVESWGAGEVMITSSDGVFLRSAGRTYFEPFTNRSGQGRTGRGDTALGAYIARRLDHDAAESLAFAAALVSIKLERFGPFRGSETDVLERMATDREGVSR